MKTHYENLQVDEKASREVIEVAFRTLHEKWHPDRHPDQRQRAERASKAIEAAYKVLSSTVLRADYDESLKEQREGELALNEPRTQRDSVAQVKSPTTQASVSIPEPGIGTLEPKIMIAEERFAEARADGERSREQGFKVRDCPYEGELREAWKQGFKGGYSTSNSATATKLGSHIRSQIGRVWRGEEGLAKTFWIYGVLGSHIVGLVMFFVIYQSQMNIWDDQKKAVLLATLRAPSYAVLYGLIISICIWRAAGKIRPLGFWAILARFLCVAPLIGIAFAIVIPALQQVQHEPQVSTPVAPSISYQQENQLTKESAQLASKTQASGNDPSNAISIEQAQEAAELRAVAARAYMTYPFLNSQGPQANNAAIDEALEIRNSYIREGYSAPQSLQMAIDAVGPKYSR